MCSSSRTPSGLRSAALAAALTLASPLGAATTIDVSSTVVTPSVKRLGILVGDDNAWDSPLLKNLVFRNPGFEGLIFRSVVHCAMGTATGCTDDNPASVWPTGFWNGATFEIIWGAAHGRTGTVVSSTAPSDGVGTNYQFGGSGIAPVAGDYMVLKKSETGGASWGWFVDVSGGGSITTETVDLPPGTEGRQAVRISALGSGQYANLDSPFDNNNTGTFVQFNGNYRLTFKAKSAGGANTLHILFTRAAPASTTLLDRTLTLSSSWSTYNVDFSAAENGTSVGSLDLQFIPINQSAVLMDDVSLTQLSGDPTNTTVFRDPVVSTLKSLRPGLLRYLEGELGNSLDNEIVPVFARQRTGYRPIATTNQFEIQYGLHEHLELCELVGAEPWIVFSVSYSTQEMRDLIEYLAGPASSPYGARRAARGRSAPWTDAFAIIHLEFGNEAWNEGDFNGAAIGDPTAYGNRGGEIFGAARGSPYFNASKFDLVLGGQDGPTIRNQEIHAASSNNDTLAVGPYIQMEVNSFATNEQLFGPLFAEPELVSRTGAMRQNLNFIQGSPRPVRLSVYETNLHTTAGAISQTALDSFTPSLGAGLAVADHMLMMLRDLGIRDQMLCCLAGFQARRTDGKTARLWGATRDMGVTNRKRPQFLGMKLANEVLAGDLVRTAHTGDDPTWDQPSMNGVQLNGAHYLQSYAFSNGTSRSLIVFNLHRTSALDVNFSGVNAPSGTVTLKRLTSAATTDTNEDVENVVTTTQTLSGFDSSRSISLPPYSMSLFQWQAAESHRIRRHLIR